MKLFLFIATVLLVQAYYAHPVEEAVNQAEDAGTLLWAVLVAGSNSYYNYRHQSDICHAYQIMKRHGIPDERIIVMMYDDIAHNSQNPHKGMIINRPNGPNVYPGVLKDYTGPDVNPDNFLNVLTGNAEGIQKKGPIKVLKSGPNDHVFVYFADHGGPDVLSFPSKILTAEKLHKALVQMHQNNMYNKMVIYIEACESGSMFIGSSKLPPNMRIYATTAANAKESSYATYFSKEFDTYLGDLYSVKWMEDTDKENIQRETLEKQFELVKKETNMSHVTEFGNETISKMFVGQFQGTKKAEPIYAPKFVANDENTVSSREVPMFIKMRRLENAKSIGEKLEILQDLSTIIEQRLTLVQNMKSICDQVFEEALELKEVQVKESEDCYYTVINEYNAKCYDIALNTYSLGYLYNFKNFCEAGVKPEVILKHINNNCNGAAITGTV